MSPAPRNGERIDVREMIRQASSRVRVDQLVQQGRKYISLLSKDKIDELINQAVRNIVGKHRGGESVPQDRLEAESKEEFKEIFQEYRQQVRARSGLEESREALAAELEDLRRDLREQKALADGRLSEDLERTLVLGFRDFERELDRITGEVFEKRELVLRRSDTPEAVAELKRVEDVLRAVIRRILAAERERFQSEGGRNRLIALLEKRMEKLYAQIGTLETALRTISSSKLYSNQQLQNVLRQLGLATDDKNFEKKREMLKVVLGANVDLRAKARELESKGITLATPARRCA